MSYAVINTTTNLVENKITWDGQANWTPPEACVAVEIPADSPVSIGWSYSDGEFTPSEES